MYPWSVCVYLFLFNDQRLAFTGRERLCLDFNLVVKGWKGKVGLKEDGKEGFGLSVWILFLFLEVALLFLDVKKEFSA